MFYAYLCGMYFFSHIGKHRTQADIGYQPFRLPVKMYLQNSQTHRHIGTQGCLVKYCIQLCFPIFYAYLCGMYFFFHTKENIENRQTQAINNPALPVKCICRTAKHKGTQEHRVDQSRNVFNYVYLCSMPAYVVCISFTHKETQNLGKYRLLH